MVKGEGTVYIKPKRFIPLLSPVRATEVVDNDRDINGEIRRIRAGGISNKPRHTYTHTIYKK